MNLRRGKRKNESGNVILICVMFSVVLGITIASYLLVVRSQYISNARSHNWNISLVLAEAGVEDALGLVNKNMGDFPNLKNWPAGAAADGWMQVSNVFHVQRTPDASLGFYDVWITNLDNAVIIYVEGTATWDTSNPDPTANGGNVRKLVVQAGVEPLFSYAVASGNNIDLNNKALSLASYDSSDPAASTAGAYDPAKRKAGGKIAANGSISNVPSGTKISGSVYTGPGGLTNMQQYSSVGDLTWLSPGIQASHGRDDMNVVFPPVILPAANFSVIDTSTNNNPITISNNGYYRVIDNYGLKHSLTVTASNVVLYLEHGLDYTGWSPYAGWGPPNRRLRVPTNSTLTIYAGEKILFDDDSAIRSTNVENLTIYGLATLSTVELWGFTNFSGSIYAPQADITIGANSGLHSLEPMTINGSVIGRTVKVKSSLLGTQDEKLLGSQAPGRAYVATNWTEL